MSFDRLRPGMGRNETIAVLSEMGLTVLPAAQNYDHILLGEKVLESPNGHPLRIDLAAGLTDSSIRMIKSGYQRALGYKEN